MTINEYYTKELQALRSLGAEFSEKNPGLSSFLSRKGQDPDVERLLEGFSFLTGRLRQYMDEQLPEVAHSLANLLWPNYLKPIPSYAILQYTPENTDGVIQIKKGEEVSSIHDKNDTECIFQTCYNTDVYPLEIIDAHYYNEGEQSIIEISFKTLQDISLDDLNLEKLRLYIGDHEHVSDNLYLELMQNVDSVDVVVEKEFYEKKLKNGSIKPVGFSDDENILPQIKNVFSGYRLLKEYFCYRDKYHFIDIINLDILKKFPESVLKKKHGFSLKIKLSRKLKITKKITKDNFKLYCTPIINIFDTTAYPIKKSLHEEYEVLPGNIEYEDSEVYSIEKVHGWDSRKNKKHTYVSFKSFEHAEKNMDYYSTSTKLSEDETRTKTYLRFDPKNSISSDQYHDGLTVSVDIKVTNRDLPSLLHIGDISKTTVNSTVSKVTFENITVPSKSYIPPIRGDFLWRVISNMSLNYLSLDSVDTLRNILGTYDFIGASNVLQKKHTDSLLSGISNIEQSSTDMIYKGLPIRGTLSRLTLDSKKYATIGEAYLFSSILNEFFSLYCSINSFHKLEVIIDKKAHFTWKAKLGKQVLL